MPLIEVENHVLALSLYFMQYNFVRTHKTLANPYPKTPAMVTPLINSPKLTDVLSAHRPVNDRWTYYWRSSGHVSQIDFILASRALSNRISAAVASSSSKKPHIERQGLAYKGLNTSGNILPKEVTLVYFEPDPVTPSPNNVPVNEKISFGHPRYREVMEDWSSNISDHCPVKIWF